MSISPVSFTGAKVVLDSKYIGKQAFWDEARISDLMRKKGGVDIPVIGGGFSSVKNGGFVAEFQPKGDIADAGTNPIENKHFKKLFRNLFLIDKANGYHGNLSLQNIYFANDGTVEMAHFRNLSSFTITDDDKFIINGRLSTHAPKSFMPSNAENFEQLSLGRYLRTIKSADAKYEFMHDYLAAKGEYNSKRLEKLEEIGLSPSSDAVRYETVQKSVFEESAFGVLDFNLEKMEMYAKRQDAVASWVNGNGKIDGVLKPMQRFNSVILLLDCLEDSVRLKEMAKYFSASATDSDTAEYFELEYERVKYFADEIIGSVGVCGQSNFNDQDYDSKKSPSGNKIAGKGLYLGYKDSLVAFNKLYSKINLDDSCDDTLCAIKDLRNHYRLLMESWNPDMNSIFKEDYVA